MNVVDPTTVTGSGVTYAEACVPGKPSVEIVALTKVD